MGAALWFLMHTRDGSVAQQATVNPWEVVAMVVLCAVAAAISYKLRPRPKA
jgi:hypothetical protein